MLERCTALERLTLTGRVGHLRLSGCSRLAEIRTLPDQLTPSVLICEDNSDLVSLPASLRTMRQLTLRRCPSVEALPEHLTRVERLEVPHCSRLRALPPRLRVTETLNVYQCEALTALPERMGAPHRAEIGRSGLTGLPAGWEAVALTWDRVAVTPPMIFQTAALSPVEVLTEPNAEIRWILIERFGVTRLLREADATILDRDTDAVGVRELLSVPLPNGEPPLVGLKVRCPSTGRIHLRVPPWMRTCHAAAAWLAGFDNPADYAPILET